MRAHAPAPARSTSGDVTFESALGVVLAALLVLSAIVHITVAQSRYEAWGPEGLFFIGLAAAEGALAYAVMWSTGPRVLRAVMLFSVGSAVTWLASRVVGLPMGPYAWLPETFGVADVIYGVAAVAAAGCSWLALVPRGASHLTRPLSEARFLTLILCTAAGIAVLGFLGVDAAMRLT